MKTPWILSERDLEYLSQALHREIVQTEQTEKEGLPETSAQQFQEYLQELRDLAARLSEIHNAVCQQDGAWAEHDLAMVRITHQLESEPYTIAPWGPDRWIVVAKDDPACRPVNQRYYTAKTHAHRAKRRLNKAARQMQPIMAANSGALIV